MPQFTYKAKSDQGQIRDGIIQAENKLVVIKKLRQESLFPMSIEETIPVAVKKKFKKVNSRDFSAFTRQLSNLIHAGFPLTKALSTLSQQEQNPGFKKLIEDLLEKIQKGSTFSAALSVYPDIFSSFYINMVKIGEAGGKVDDALERLADFKEREDELLAQIKAALIYPVFIVSVGIITIFVVMTFFIPRFAAMFSDLGQALPLPTQIIMQISGFMNKFWWCFIAAVGVVVVLARSYYKAEKNRLFVDGVMLRLPLVKAIINKVEIARFSYALGILLKHGLPVLEALKVVGSSVDNRVFRKKIVSFQEEIRQGQSLSKCLKADKLFPPILVNMVTVGEESGELNEMLLKIAGTFEKDVNRVVKAMVSLIEPVLIIFIGGIVVVIVLSILLPLFRMDLLVS
jgi:type II secretory pathway component PulF